MSTKIKRALFLLLAFAVLCAACSRKEETAKEENPKNREQMALAEKYLGCLLYTSSTLEGKIVRFSDKIAYINHDIDDAIRGRIITEHDIPRRYTEVLGNSVKERLNIMVHDIILNSLDRPEIVMSQDVLDTMVSLRQWMFENVYKNPAAKAEEGKAQQLIVRLYAVSYTHLSGPTARWLEEIRRPTSILSQERTERASTVSYTHLDVYKRQS